MTNIHRCSWPGEDPYYVAYHDEEWGVPVRDGQALFEKLILDGFQAGLSWITILRKREAFIKAFDSFDPQKIARYTPKKVERLMQDAGIVRNRSKIESTISSAQAWLDMEESGQSFEDFIWGFVDGKVVQNSWKNESKVPVDSTQSIAMSKALKQAGFKYCGPTICYAFMQAVGLINDHTTKCFRHKELS
ncbi:MAG: DNA-3-methyladenine glycosylase I [Alphaproteobacteria bacterium]|jgi:DNA-3-methyladenine glycosylase I|nr:DNA-3-methyladenine glycosylase I [Alphaproteobacteria bacterium]MBT4086098.1 DNA-3-methyladenine glycosylase I [Alphaproteobacteria bacterium]MBT4543715.1 DNA-3-methyladenine glycosylase I [Alphaproteobacteria bacterium]MBT7743960.1 DNA-3-methyladenine glycosylase I [Alphaproteobacteria bacterium]